MAVQKNKMEAKVLQTETAMPKILSESSAHGVSSDLNKETKNNLILPRSYSELRIEKEVQDFSKSCSGFFKKTYDGLIQAINYLPYIPESILYVVVYNLPTIARAVLSPFMIAGKASLSFLGFREEFNLSKILEEEKNDILMIETKSKWINNTREVFNKYSWSGSLLGDDKKFANTTDLELKEILNPLNNISKSFVEPLTTPLHDIAHATVNRLTHISYNIYLNYSEKRTISYNDFLKAIEEEQNWQLRMGRTALYTVESFLIAHRCGAVGSKTSREAISRTFQFLGMPAFMSLLSVVANILKQENFEQMTKEEIASELCSQLPKAVFDSASFMLPISLASQAYIKRGITNFNVKLFSKSEAELPQSLSKYQRDVNLLVSRVQGWTELFDSAEGFPDAFNSGEELRYRIINLSNNPFSYQNWKLFFATGLEFSAAALDLVDIKNNSSYNKSLHNISEVSQKGVDKQLSSHSYSLENLEEVRQYYRDYLFRKLNVEGPDSILKYLNLSNVPTFLLGQRDLLREQIVEQSKNIYAFYDKERDVIFYPKLEENTSREQKVLHQSYIVHEELHREVAKKGIEVVLTSRAEVVSYLTERILLNTNEHASIDNLLETKIGRTKLEEYLAISSQLVFLESEKITFTKQKIKEILKIKNTGSIFENYAIAADELNGGMFSEEKIKEAIKRVKNSPLAAAFNYSTSIYRNQLNETMNREIFHYSQDYVVIDQNGNIGIVPFGQYLFFISNFTSVATAILGGPGTAIYGSVLSIKYEISKTDSKQLEIEEMQSSANLSEVKEFLKVCKRQLLLKRLYDLIAITDQAKENESKKVSQFFYKNLDEETRNTLKGIIQGELDFFKDQSIEYIEILKGIKNNTLTLGDLKKILFVGCYQFYLKVIPEKYLYWELFRGYGNFNGLSFFQGKVFLITKENEQLTFEQIKSILNVLLDIEYFATRLFGISSLMQFSEELFNNIFSRKFDTYVLQKSFFSRAKSGSRKNLTYNSKDLLNEEARNKYQNIPELIVQPQRQSLNSQLELLCENAKKNGLDIVTLNEEPIVLSVDVDDISDSFVDKSQLLVVDGKVKILNARLIFKRRYLETLEARRLAKIIQPIIPNDNLFFEENVIPLLRGVSFSMTGEAHGLPSNNPKEHLQASLIKAADRIFPYIEILDLIYSIKYFQEDEALGRHDLYIEESMKLDLGSEPISEIITEIRKIILSGVAPDKLPQAISKMLSDKIEDRETSLELGKICELLRETIFLAPFSESNSDLKLPERPYYEDTKALESSYAVIAGIAKICVKRVLLFGELEYLEILEKIYKNWTDSILTSRLLIPSQFFEDTFSKEQFSSQNFLYYLDNKEIEEVKAKLVEMFPHAQSVMEKLINQTRTHVLTKEDYQSLISQSPYKRRMERVFYFIRSKVALTIVEENTTQEFVSSTNTQLRRLLPCLNETVEEIENNISLISKEDRTTIYAHIMDLWVSIFYSDSSDFECHKLCNTLLNLCLKVPRNNERKTFFETLLWLTINEATREIKNAHKTQTNIVANGKYQRLKDMIDLILDFDNLLIPEEYITQIKETLSKLETSSDFIKDENESFAPEVEMVMDNDPNQIIPRIVLWSYNELARDQILTEAISILKNYRDSFENEQSEFSITTEYHEEQQRNINETVQIFTRQIFALSAVLARRFSMERKQTILGEHTISIANILAGINTLAQETPEWLVTDPSSKEAFSKYIDRVYLRGKEEKVPSNIAKKTTNDPRLEEKVITELQEGLELMRSCVLKNISGELFDNEKVASELYTIFGRIHSSMYVKFTFENQLQILELLLEIFDIFTLHSKGSHEYIERAYKNTLNFISSTLDDSLSLELKVLTYTSLLEILQKTIDSYYENFENADVTRVRNIRERISAIVNVFIGGNLHISSDDYQFTADFLSWVYERRKNETLGPPKMPRSILYFRNLDPSLLPDTPILRFACLLRGVKIRISQDKQYKCSAKEQEEFRKLFFEHGFDPRKYFPDSDTGLFFGDFESLLKDSLTFGIKLAEEIYAAKENTNDIQKALTVISLLKELRIDNLEIKNPEIQSTYFKALESISRLAFTINQAEAFNLLEEIVELGEELFANHHEFLEFLSWHNTILTAMVSKGDWQHRFSNISSFFAGKLSEDSFSKYDQKWFQDFVGDKGLNIDDSDCVDRLLKNEAELSQQQKHFFYCLAYLIQRDDNYLEDALKINSSEVIIQRNFNLLISILYMKSIDFLRSGKLEILKELENLKAKICPDALLSKWFISYLKNKTLLDTSPSQEAKEKLNEFLDSLG